MKYYIITYGCQMNKSDSERLAAVLDDLGYTPTNSEQAADLIATVACSVRQSAIDRIYGRVKIWNKIRKAKKLITILTGCVLKSDQKKLQKAFDFILDIKELNKLPTLLKNKKQLSQKYLSIVPKYKSPFQAYVPISIGCNNYCTYCVVPYARGPEKYRPAEEIVDEVKCLIKNGYKEITLLGQNVNSYRSRINTNGSLISTNIRKIGGKISVSSREVSFPKLLQTINDLPGNFWLRFITSHPKDLSDELIMVMAHGKKICKYLHLPVQAGDNCILKAMNRHYTVAHYKNLIKKIRQAIPGIAISTDIIVGFPGETKKQFNNTAKLMKEINFDMAYIAEYSPRPGTAAAKLKDDVPQKEKEHRRILLTKILKKSALKNNQKYLNKIVEVLVEDKNRDFLYGKTRTFKTVKIKKSPSIKLGDITKIKIINVQSFGLEGVIVK